MILHPLIRRVREADPVGRLGYVNRVLAGHIEADGPNLPLGALCKVETAGSGAVHAQVVGIRADCIVLAPLEAHEPSFAGAKVTASQAFNTAPVGDAFMGRVVDALGRPVDGGEPIRAARQDRLGYSPEGMLSRVTSRRSLETGVRAIDGLLTLSQGQRIGIFAASGVGKTSLLTQLAQQVKADRCVVCLIGERGREVENLWAHELNEEGRGRTVLVAATSDQTAAMRVRACDYALTLASYWREQGHHVLLLLDSMTRLAMAMREIGLASGEPPTVRAYTPNVFSALPKLVERCGALKSGGAITAIMTILSETDEVDDPVCEMMKSLLDGHIVLSRTLAEQGHFPAIDVSRSISRLASTVASHEDRARAIKALELMGVYDNSKTLIEAGMYVPGSSSQIDLALEKRPALLTFLRQGTREHTALQACNQALASVMEAGA